MSWTQVRVSPQGGEGGGGVNPSDGRQGTRQAAKEVIRIKQHKTTSYFRSRKKGKAKPC